MWVFEVYIDRANQHRWRRWSSNSRVIADSGEGYGSLRDCEHAIWLVKQNAPTAQVRVTAPR